MALDRTDVEKIAHLSRLSLEEKDIPDYVQSLSSILALVDLMNSVNTKDITPLAHPLDLQARLRNDDIIETNQRDHFQKNAPDVQDGYYLVPRVIE